MLPSPLPGLSLAENNKTLAKEWHPTKNGKLTPEDVFPKSGKKVWWRCRKGHEWKAKVIDRNKGHGCPYCSGHRVSEDNNLEVTNPELAKEWHPTKNGNLTPRNVTVNSNKRVWWKCKKGHEWIAGINNRNKGDGCPYCSGHRVSEDNNLEVTNPELAKEWHPTKNGNLTPRNVTPGSTKKVWWICARGHEWSAIIYARNQGNNCPYCSGQRVCYDNCLETINPTLAKEWHPTRNVDLTPMNVTPGSGKKVWWRCSRGHEWEASVYNRSKGRGCPYCGRSKKILLEHI